MNLLRATSLGLVLMLGATACGTTQAQRINSTRTALAASGEVINTASEELVKVDTARLADISATCPSVQACQAAIMAEDVAFTRAQSVLTTASAAIVTAAQVVSLVESGSKDVGALLSLLPGLADLVLKVEAAVAAFKTPPTGPAGSK